MAAHLVATRPFDVAVSHFALYAIPVLRLIRQGRPLIVHFHGPWAAESRFEGANRLGCVAKAMLERHVYRRADRLIVLSTAFKELLIRDYGVAATRVRIVPGGTDCGRFDIVESRQQARARLGWDMGRPTILAVRRLTPRMGLENLIEAAALVRKIVPDALFLIAGSGGLRFHLETVVAERGLARSVRLLGFVSDSDLPLAYRAADLSVVPTVALEGFGLVAAESLAAGTPAMATPVGGLVDLLSPLSSAMLFATAAPADISTGLIDVLTGKTALPTAGECVAYARQRFNWEVIAAEGAAVYREAVVAYSSERG